MNKDTIYAVSTGIGKAAIAVVRVSGPGTDDVLEQLCRTKTIAPRRASLLAILDCDGNLIDRGLVIKFDGPKSFTGESMLELQITGGRAVVRNVLDAISLVPGVRPAEAGEFARRAFDNGKLDLSEIEGLAQVVDAETRIQLKQAHMLATGELRKECDLVSEVLINVIAMVESTLDFSDVEDTSSLNTYSIIPQVTELISRLERIVANSVLAERLREGMSVVIAGHPNAGKSTLLNCLAKRDVAIVSPIPGTTRDSIDVLLELEGFPVVLTDTAGIRHASDPIELSGIERARQKASTADLVLWLQDGDESHFICEEFSVPIVLVRTKSDLNSEAGAHAQELSISAKTGAGIDRLLAYLAEFAREHFAGVGNIAVATERQRLAVKDTLIALYSVLHDPEKPAELIAEDLRLAATYLGRVSGRIDVEEILGQIFSQLCVGK